MRKFRVADISMLDRLIEMTKIGFDETDRSVKFFFDKKVNLQDCVVCMEDNKPVAQLHMLPVSIRNKDELVPAHYIYAASTLPEYRGQGCMTELIEYACKIADSKGHKFSILSPATDKLFKFYRKLGYYKFHKYREVILSSEEMKKFPKSREISSEIDYSRVQDIRSKFFNISGEVVWDIDSLKYAFDMNKNLNGVNIFNGDGYAISTCSAENVVDTFELAYVGENIETLFGDIYNTYGDRNKYIMRLPVRSEFLDGRGKIVNKSMIRPVCKREKKRLMNFIMSTSQQLPCMGFVLE